jgi:hypothetical protein
LNLLFFQVQQGKKTYSESQQAYRDEYDTGCQAAKYQLDPLEASFKAKMALTWLVGRKLHTRVEQNMIMAQS